MKIYKHEREAMTRILMKNHKISSKRAQQIIDERDNKYMKELTSKIRKENNRKKKELPKNFVEEFRKMKVTQ